MAEDQEKLLLTNVIEGLNLLIMQVCMVSYYDDTDDVEAVLQLLLDMLNGFSDVPTPGDTDNVQ